MNKERENDSLEAKAAQLLQIKCLWTAQYYLDLDIVTGSTSLLYFTAEGPRKLHYKWNDILIVVIK